MKLGPHMDSRLMYHVYLNQAAAVSGIFIVSAKRTAFGTYGGKLKDVSATTLQEIAAKGALDAAKVDPKLVGSVVFGNVMQSSADAIYLARHVGLRCGVGTEVPALAVNRMCGSGFQAVANGSETSTDAAYFARHVGLKVGVPIEVPALAVNRLCGSGFQAIANGAQEIVLGMSEIALVGGTESMSGAPYAVRNVRFGTRLGQDLKLEDVLWAGLSDTYTGMPMAITAEKLAEQYGITREECDKFALKSQRGWAAANEKGIFKTEITPMEVKGKKGKESFEVDEHPRPQSTIETLAKLPAVFKKGGTVTAGNASGVCDGAAALVLASEAACTKHNLTPLARLVAYGMAGCDPTIMGIGPVPASKAALKAAGMELKDMEICEVNEAFAPQYLAVEKELGLNPDITNMNGGAIAVGHPLGASGARITGHLTHELRRQNKTYALGSACIGGGMGMTVILQRV